VPENRYTPEIANAVLTRISEGTPLRQAARELGIAESTVREWVRRDEDGMAERYKQARAMQIDAWADEVLVVTYRDDLDANDKRVRADALKWLISRLAPARYGDKLAIAGDPDSPLRVIHDQVSIESLAPEQLEAVSALAVAMMAKKGGG
jgi:transposase-like protein